MAMCYLYGYHANEFSQLGSTFFYLQGTTKEHFSELSMVISQQVATAKIQVGTQISSSTL